MTDVLENRAPFSSLEVAFARSMARLSGDGSDELLLGAAAALHALAHGDLCYMLGDELKSATEDTDVQNPIDASWPEAVAWAASLRASPAVEAVGRQLKLNDADSDHHAARPLVLDLRGRLYLRRTFAEQQQVADALSARAKAVMDVDEEVLGQSLARLFAGAGPEDLQRQAAALVARRRLSLITGGPGTGKTTLVAKVLASLVEQALHAGSPPPRIALTAPTGKAAARMAESLAVTVQGLDLLPAVLAAIPTSASTMHRLLGLAPGMRRRAPEGRLAYDVVIVDEASMVDLALMAELTRALAANTRLVLLGDADQLASVAEGAVFADLCAASEGSALATARVRLTVGHRYGADSAVGHLAESVRSGDAAAALQLLSRGSAVALHHCISRRGTDDAFFDLACAGYAPLLAATDPDSRLRAFDRFRVLTAHRRGCFGAQGVAARLREALMARGSLPRLPDGAPSLEPVLIVRNSPALGLNNGDVGFVERRPGVEPLAHFRLEGGSVRTFSPSRLPAHESAWAMTIHKSQGSEFDRVALVLPERLSAVCTRELVYTAVTRARHGVDIYAPEAVVAGAIRCSTQRRGGLRDQLARD